MAGWLSRPSFDPSSRRRCRWFGDPCVACWSLWLRVFAAVCAPARQAAALVVVVVAVSASGRGRARARDARQPQGGNPGRLAHVQGRSDSLPSRLTNELEAASRVSCVLILSLSFCCSQCSHQRLIVAGRELVGNDTNVVAAGASRAHAARDPRFARLLLCCS